MTPSGLQKRSVISRESPELSNEIFDLVAEEVPIAVAYNGKTHAVMMASPVALKDFAVGFSLTEGTVDQLVDIKSIDIIEAKQGISIQVHIPANLVQRLSKRERSLSGRAGCGICGLTDIAAAVPQLGKLEPAAVPSHASIDKAAKTLQEKQTLQQACGGIHGAALCSAAGDVLLVREDIGRHNALDKLIGASVRSNSKQPFKDDDFVLLSSRASHELVNKCVMAGVKSLVTISAASSLAIDVAQKSNLNLVGFVRGDRQLVYTN